MVQATSTQQFKSFFLISLVFMLAIVGMSVYFMNLFAPNLLDAFNRKVFTESTAVAREINQSIDLGIPLDKVRGWDDYFDFLRDRSNELVDMAVFSEKKDLGSISELSSAGSADEIVPSQAIYHHGLVKMDLTGPLSYVLNMIGLDRLNIQTIPLESEKDSYIVLTYDRYFAFNLVDKMLYDILSVLIVVFVLLYEMRRFLQYLYISKPIALARQWIEKTNLGQIVHIGSKNTMESFGAKAQGLFSRHSSKKSQALVIGGTHEARIVTFFFMVAIEMSRPFLPLAIEQAFLQNPVNLPYSLSLLVGLPVIGFMLLSIVGIFIASKLLNFLQLRLFLLLSIVLALVLYIIISIFGFDLSALSISWVITGLSYGFLVIGIQGYLMKNVAQNQRSRALIQFAQGVFSALIVGPMIGGFLVDYLGYSALFSVASFVLIVGLFLCAKYVQNSSLLESERLDHLKESGKVSWQLKLFMLLSAMPAKLALTGVLFFALPIQLNALSYEKTDIGRLIMLYSVCVVMTLPILGAVLKRFQKSYVSILLLFLSGLLTMFGFLIIPIGTLGIILGILLFGVAQAIAICVQPIVIENLAKYYACSVVRSLSVYRGIERLGGLLGPVLFTALVGVLTYFESIQLVGYSVMALTALCVMFLGVVQLKRR